MQLIVSIQLGYMQAHNRVVGHNLSINLLQRLHLICFQFLVPKSVYESCDHTQFPAIFFSFVCNYREPVN